MRAVYLFLAFFFLRLTCLAQSPIQLGNVNMPQGGDTLRYSNADLLSLPDTYTQTGINFHWDFSTLQSTSQGVRKFENANQTPYSFYFLSSGTYGEKIADTIDLLVVQLANVYNFYRKQTFPSAFLADGMGLSVTGFPAPAYYGDKDELYNFPMTCPQHDSTTFKFSTPNTTLIPIVYSKTGYRITDVDGWGTITTPYGTEECLRLITTQYSQDTVIISIPGLPVQLPPFGIPNYQRSYQWLTKTSKIPYLEITGNLLLGNFVPTTIRYRDKLHIIDDVGIEKHKDISGLELYPNPVSDKLFLTFTKPGTYAVEIYDIGGKLLKTLQTEALSENCFVGVENLQAGLYLIKISAGERERYFKFIKQ